MKKCKQGGHKCRLLHEKMQAGGPKTQNSISKAAPLLDSR